MTARRIDHTAIAVRDMDEAVERYRRLFGAEVADRRHIPDQQVEVAFLALGDTCLELIQPTDASSGVARFLASRGEALHHIGILVTDLRRELDEYRARGFEPVDAVPRSGAHGLVAFIHPRTTGGVLIELVQRDNGQ